MGFFSSVWSRLFGGNQTTSISTVPANPVPLGQQAAVWPPADEDEVLAATLWMEARGDGSRGMQAVANVICNRAKRPSWWGKDIRSVCLSPYQFSSWNDDSPEIAPLMAVMDGKGAVADLQAWQEALSIADMAAEGRLPDITLGSDSYYEPSANEKPPVWAVPSKFRGQIGSQLFYRVQD